MPKVRKEKAAKELRHDPLAQQIIEEESNRGIRKVPRTKQRKGHGEDDEEDDVLPAKMTQKVLALSSTQKAEDMAGEDDMGDETMGEIQLEEDLEDVEVDEEGYVVTTGASDEDERALSLFLPTKGAQPKSLNLADMILSKIHEHEAKAEKAEAVKEAAAEGFGLSPKVIQVYTDIGKWLKHYKSGKIPKAFKVIPSLTNWEEVLALTDPLGWSAAAMYEAVNIFVSNLNPRMAQRFFNLVLLPALRQDIAMKKKLHFSYFRSLHKSLFKPAAFFKGILLPLCQENCSLREAMIVSAVLAKASVPPMHAAAVICRLCTMTPWYGTTSIFIATLVNKKYALPLRVIECLSSHFCAFAEEERILPVVWHRALLVFIQRYKFELSDDQRRRLKELLRVHFHDSIGPEARRELLAPKPGEAPAPASSAMDVDM
eukprot:gnl/TRDRNA2_/TRDRNA2_39688_c0_seq1.p1 gnl/TRDRNA2_/TRDRNA2_39688_c0~~gnl/TRDRNA2_/TRDRNA2_39688_c0_seq1.p1  ORF type:complete len:450 (-),score=118.62 gnl/TRDRNA2_/TRDRNA2_39688_c0_seq1:45-1331(-)